MQLVITKTPMRVSFFGGGTDLRSFYKNYGGCVLSTTINKYLYVTVKKNQNYVDYKYRVNWSKTEFANKIKDIQHPIVREVFKFFKINFPCEVSTFADIPANTGMGSSSAFAVGLIKGISTLIGKNYSNKKIAEIAAKIEVDKLKRNIGKQDHYACAIGGLNLFLFEKNEKVNIKKITLNKSFYKILSDSMYVFFLNKKRDASYILQSQKKLKKKNILILKDLKKISLDVFKKLKKIKKKNFLTLFGKNLSKSWLLKVKNNTKVSFSLANRIYNYAESAGAYGGKLLGAGGGGYFLFLTNISVAKKIEKKTKHVSLLKIDICKEGTKILYSSN